MRKNLTNEEWPQYLEDQSKQFEEKLMSAQSFEALVAYGFIGLHRRLGELIEHVRTK